ncbi:CYTH and CHAD domain-containing protein [Rhodobium gokarnense]|uniref:Inorganic triphosphatase YgiF n=1 Tax=Rhodobium gokarnense TaxID=364296 RepID=A0ABT3H8U5_9HYPH|nr:CYTH and CHAD domain-containing protein [Rhodobium gokarnense]MCW2306816.1 inorganic triphosphatase YgiF [Rhodobium gokarnense]
MTTPREIELKLRIDPERMARLRKSAWWKKLGRGRKKTLHNTYFDTAEQALRGLGVDLRIRHDGSTYRQTIKLRDPGDSGISRTEWEAIVPDAVPDPSLVIDEALPEPVRGLTSADVAPVFSSEVTRETRTFAADGAEIELAYDDGTIMAGDARLHFCELELELKDGDPAALFAEAEAINAVVPTRLHLFSKSDAGYRLAASKLKPWSKAEKLDLDPQMTAGEALSAIVGTCLSHLTANDECARVNCHIEGVHQSRVAARRLRSAFGTFKDVVDGDVLTPLSEEVRWLGSSMGPARDLDVLKADLFDPVMATMEDTSLLDALIARGEILRAAAYEEVAAALSSERYGALLIDLCRFMETRPGLTEAAKMPVVAFARRSLDTLHAKLLKRGRKFEKLSAEKRHRVRIAVKKMRYAVEFFGGLFPGKKQERYNKRLAALQDDLGRLNDVAMAETMIERLTAPIPGAPEATAEEERRRVLAGGQVLGWHQRRAAEIDRQLIKDWYAFADTRPFWHDKD